MAGFHETKCLGFVGGKFNGRLLDRIALSETSVTKKIRGVRALLLDIVARSPLFLRVEDWTS